MQDGRKNNGGHAKVGRKSRAEKGLPPTVNVTVRIDQETRDKVIRKYGKIAKALREIAKDVPDEG